MSCCRCCRCDQEAAEATRVLLSIKLTELRCLPWWLAFEIVVVHAIVLAFPVMGILTVLDYFNIPWGFQ